MTFILRRIAPLLPFFLPLTYVFAQSHTSAGLIPCGAVTGSGSFTIAMTASECNLCDLVTLIGNINNFLIGLAVPISIGLFAWAGIMYFTSGGNPAQITRAHKVFKSVLIGFAIALSAWLVVQTVLTTLVNPNSFLSGSWNSLPQCSQARPRDSSVGAMFTSLGATTPTSAGGGIMASGVPAANIGTAEMNAQILNSCAQTGVDCALAQKIAVMESSGGVNCQTSPTGAAGCMQVLATTACGVDASISASCGDCTRSGQSLSTACAPVVQTLASNSQVGTAVGVKYIGQLQDMPKLQALQSQFGVCQITAASYFQGPGNVVKAGGVPANAAVYVSNVCGS